MRGLDMARGRFPIDAQVGGHVIVTVFPDDARSPLQISVCGTRVTYANVETGTTIRLRDGGPDRFYTKDGKVCVAITGRSVTGSGVIGLVILDLATEEVAFTAGNDTGNFYDGFCEVIG